MTTELNLIAAYIAKNGVTKIATGARAYDEWDMVRAERGATRVQSIAQKESALIAGTDRDMEFALHG